MTEQEVMEWMEKYLEGEKHRSTTFGMIRADIMDYGFKGFLDLPPETVIESYREVTDEITQEAVDDFKAMFNQEQDLDSLGIDQSFRLNPPQTMQAMRDGMTDIMKSLMLYIEVQRMANTLLEHEE